MVDVVTKLWNSLYLGVDGVIRSFRSQSVPTTPAMLATAVDFQSIDLTITTPSTIAGNAPVYGYKFYRLTGGNWVPISSDTVDLTLSSGTFTVSLLSPSTQYSFRCEAVSVESVYSTPSSTVLATTEAVPVGNTEPRWVDGLPDVYNFAENQAFDMTFIAEDPDIGDLIDITAGAHAAGINVEIADQVGTERSVRIWSSGLTPSSYDLAINLDAAMVGGALPILTLTNGGTDKPWTFGHAFKQGDVPTGQYLTATGPSSFQADVRNRWSDGSVKFAVLSGIGGTQAILGTTTAAPGTPMAEPVSVDASVTFTNIRDYLGAVLSAGPVIVTVPAGQTASFTAAAWADYQPAGRTYSNASGLVRSILGPVMSEFHYYAKVPGDNHLCVWFYVRVYSTGAVEVETIVENGWCWVGSPGSRVYTAVVTVGGTTRYTATNLDHKNRTRWSREDWVGVNPAITPSHDPAYLQATKLVPRYGYAGAPTSAAWTTQGSLGWTAPITTVNPVPFVLGNYSTPMANTGYAEHIGPLPRWEALYVTSADARAYTATIGNARNYGRYSIHARDEATGKPVKIRSYPAAFLITTNDSWRGIYHGQNGSRGPDPVGGYVDQFDGAHHPSAGYLAYLLTGRRQFLESVQFVATVPFYMFASAAPEQRSNGAYIISWSTDNPRFAAWGLRTVAQAACITSDGDSLDGEWEWQFASNMLNYKTKHHPGGIYYTQLGVTKAAGQYQYPPWQNDFFTSVMGWAWDMEICGDANHQWVRNWLCSGVVLRLAPTIYANTANYNPNLSPGGVDDPAQAYPTWEAVYAANGIALTAPLLSGVGANVPPAGFQLSYWGNFMPAVAAAVNAGEAEVPGITAAYARLTQTSTNWQSCLLGYADNPTWGVSPR